MSTSMCGSKYLQIDLVRPKPGDNHIMVILKDIGAIIYPHMKFINKQYQDAIEANYSHEQMTPLNSVICNSKLCRIHFKNLYSILDNSNLSALDPAKQK